MVKDIDNKKPVNPFDKDDDDIFKSLEKGIDTTINLDKKEEWETIKNSLDKMKDEFLKD
jgi:hypothetical protein